MRKDGSVSIKIDPESQKKLAEIQARFSQQLGVRLTASQAVQRLIFEAVGAAPQ